MEGGDNLAKTWPFISILPFALAIASNCAAIEMHKLTPLYPKG
jgi:hypothetical protein